LTAQALNLRSDASRWDRVRHELARVPWHGLKQNGNQALITSAATYAGAMFSMQHSVFPWYIAWPLAIGFEWTYLAGIALAGDIRRGSWALAINATAMLTSAAFGMLYILGVYAIIPEHPEPLAAVLLAAAHILPITLMSFFYATAHRAHSAQGLADADAVTRRQQAIEDEQRALTDEWRREKLAIEIERERLALEKARQRLAKSAANSGANTANTPDEAPSTASGTETRSREQLREQVTRAVRERPSANKTELARSLGIGRTLLYSLIKEAREQGEL
jgi:hypothetical protein